MKKLRAIIEYFLGENQGWGAPDWIVLTFGAEYNGNDAWKVGPFLVHVENALIGDTLYMAIRNRGKVKLVKNFKVKTLDK